VLIGRNEAGEAVATQAARLYDWRTTKGLGRILPRISRACAYARWALVWMGAKQLLTDLDAVSAYEAAE
jgi:hypothetical protein